VTSFSRFALHKQFRVKQAIRRGMSLRLSRPARPAEAITHPPPGPLLLIFFRPASFGASFALQQAGTDIHGALLAGMQGLAGDGVGRKPRLRIVMRRAGIRSFHFYPRAPNTPFSVW
jgi:hypothetical protein